MCPAVLFLPSHTCWSFQGELRAQFCLKPATHPSAMTTLLQAPDPPLPSLQFFLFKHRNYCPKQCGFQDKSSESGKLSKSHISLVYSHHPEVLRSTLHREDEELQGPIPVGTQDRCAENKLRGPRVRHFRVFLHSSSPFPSSFLPEEEPAKH